MTFAHGSARGVIAPTSRLLKITAILAQASQGGVPLYDALRQTALLGEADVVSICRIDMKCDRKSAKVLSCEGPHQQHKNLRSIDVSFAPAICKSDLLRAKTGSIWFGTRADLDDHETLSEIYAGAQLTESVYLLLDRSTSNADFLEIHFGHPIREGFAQYMSLVGPVLSDCWKKRALGRFAEAKLAKAPVKPETPASKNILSLDNPCRLSRAEYRVCSLLARGLNNNALVSELSVTMSTLRTHLRNIYAKTETCSQSELVHALLAPPRHIRTPAHRHSHVA